MIIIGENFYLHVVVLQLNRWHAAGIEVLSAFFVHQFFIFCCCKLNGIVTFHWFCGFVHYCHVLYMLHDDSVRTAAFHHLSHFCTVSKQLNVSSNIFHCLVDGPGLRFLSNCISLQQSFGQGLFFSVKVAEILLKPVSDSQHIIYCSQVASAEVCNVFQG